MLKFQRLQIPTHDHQCNCRHDPAQKQYFKQGDVTTKQFHKGVIQNECRHAKHHERRAALIICHGWTRVFADCAAIFSPRKEAKRKRRRMRRLFQFMFVRLIRRLADHQSVPRLRPPAAPLPDVPRSRHCHDPSRYDVRVVLRRLYPLGSSVQQ
jgi:hypothetical protein